jgi:hypothetical protein
MITQPRHFAPIIVWLCFGLLFIYGTDVIPEDYHLAVDVCKESDIRPYCNIIEKTALGKNTTEVCNSLQLYLNESSTFTKQCIMIFTNTDKYHIGPYFIYLMARNIWLASLSFALSDTALNILHFNGLQEWLINNHLKLLRKAYTHDSKIESISLLIGFALIVLGIIQMISNHAIATSRTTLQMREIASTTCQYYFGNECTIIEHTIYTNNSPKLSCITFGSINNWTKSQIAICKTIFSQTSGVASEYWRSDNNTVLLTIYAILLVFTNIRYYLFEIKGKVDKVISQPKDVA